MKRNLEAVFNRSTLLAGMLGMSIAGFAGIAVAQSSGEQAAPSSEAPAAIQELQATQQEMQQLMNQLRQIQQEATAANPELATKQEAYRDLVIDTMSNENFDPEAEIENMRSLQAELQGGDQLDDAERQAKMQELEQKSQQFRARQQQAMETEDVAEARTELDDKMKAAMKEQDPEAAELIAQLEQLQQEYQKLVQDAMQQQQQGSAD